MLDTDAASFRTLAKRAKKDQTKLFALSMKDIDREVAYNIQCELSGLDVTPTSVPAHNLEDIKAKLPSKYLDHLNVFDSNQAADRSSPHWPNDHKIELTNGAIAKVGTFYRLHLPSFERSKNICTST